jgi:hypothetical protein
MTESVFGGTGRPSSDDTRARTRELLRHLASGLGLRDAARRAKVKPDRVLGLLDEDEFWSAYVALREGETIARAA